MPGPDISESGRSLSVKRAPTRIGGWMRMHADQYILSAAVMAIRTCVNCMVRHSVAGPVAFSPVIPSWGNVDKTLLTAAHAAAPHVDGEVFFSHTQTRSQQALKLEKEQAPELIRLLFRTLSGWSISGRLSKSIL